MMGEAPMPLLLFGPCGPTWGRGLSYAVHVVGGAPLDLCLLATQRRWRHDSTLSIRAAAAWQWIVQAFADPCEAGRGLS